MNKTFKKRLKKVEQELLKSEMPNLIALRKGINGVIEWNGVEYANEDELHKAMKQYKLPPDKTLVILTNYSFNKTE
jgi:hypothetical protein